MLAEEQSDLTSSPDATPRSISFADDIYPLLQTHCFDCHAGATPSSGHRLDLRAKWLGETDARPLVRVGNSARSVLIERVTAESDKRMPPAGEGDPLVPEQVALLRAWIDGGMSWDDKLLPPLGDGAERDHWAFRPVKTSAPPVDAASASDWIRNPIDAFIAERQQALGLTPAAEAPRRVLIRRLYLDFLGLAPTESEVEAFVSDPKPDAYAALVDRVLASPHYGERVAQHWLDVARWGESDGYLTNYVRPFAWRYRDYVIQSFNADRPYDHFVRQQVAGDEIEPATDENLIATGFLAAGRVCAEDANVVRQHNDLLNDIVNATSSAFLGLTLACAQCHDHKFDPITQRDYYRFQGFFVGGLPGNLVLDNQAPSEIFAASATYHEQILLAVRKRVMATAFAELPPETQRVMHLPAAERTAADERIYREQLGRLNFRLVKDLLPNWTTAEEKELLKAASAALAAVRPSAVETWAFYAPASSSRKRLTLPSDPVWDNPLFFEPEKLSSAHSYLLVRGNEFEPVAALSPGWPAVFGEGDADLLARKPRTALADWLVDEHNPLTARVWVNRLWQFHFGRGLVGTAGNFGRRGALPTHPALLDWLADQLVHNGWSTKHVQRLIATSSTYRQASSYDAADAKIDPENHYLWRWPRRRIDAEALHDTLLAASGQLDRGIGGASIRGDDRATSARRSIYLQHHRDNPTQFQSLFDAPTAMAESCSERVTSTTPMQSLFLLNNEFAVRCAGALARSLQAAAAGSVPRVEAAFRRVLGRSPHIDELEATIGFLAERRHDKSRPTIVGVALAPNSQADSYPLREGVWEVGGMSATFDPSRGASRIVQDTRLDTFVLHNTAGGDTAYDQHTPDPAKAVVTYQFDQPIAVAELELIVHRNGITRVEGFAGDALDQLTSIGEATTTGAARGQPFAEEHSSHVFKFDSQRTQSGRYFRFVVRETALNNGFANYQAFPCQLGGRRITALAPDEAFEAFCQALFSLNEFIYID